MNIPNHINSLLFVLFNRTHPIFKINLSLIFMGIIISSGVQAISNEGGSFQDSDDVSGVIKASSSISVRDVHQRNTRNIVALDDIQEPSDNKSNAKINKAALRCNDDAFITTGTALLDQIRTQSFDCVGRLFDDASDAARLGTFTEANIVTVANELKNISVTYNGTDPDLYLSSLHYWIRAFYYYGNRELLTPENQAVSKDAIAALVANSHFFDKTEENANVIDLAMVNINNADIGVNFVALIYDFLDTYDKSYDNVPGWGNTFANAFWNILNQCANDASCRAAQHNTELLAKIGNYIHSNLSWLDKVDADYHLHNMGYQLGNFYSGINESHFEALRPELESQLHRIYDNFGPHPNDVARRAYLQALAVLPENQCELYNLCSKKQEIITSVLNDRINCPSGTLFMWAQDMNQDQLEWSCNSLGAHESYFHQTLQTNNIPVTPDDNENLRMIVFNDKREWRIYGFVLFDANTNNGGLYLEGDPSEAGDQATFFAYEHVSERPVFDIWNLRHEYIHYLDGRFNTKGDFRETNGAGRTVWYQEGIAEYISLKDCNDNAIAQAAQGTYSLSTIFQNEYGVGQTRIYPWGYLANRFMFEQYNSEFFAILDLFRQGQYADYRTSMVDVWVDNQTFDAEFASWLPTVESSGCEIDNTRPPSPVEPIDIADIQGSDQVGIDACALGEPVSQELLRIQAGKAICLPTISDSNQQQMGVLVPSGLVDVTLQITLRHGSGNANLLHKLDNRPTSTVYDNISSNPGNEETILVNPVKQGWNYIHMRADTDFSGVTLLARYIQNGTTPPATDTPTALSPNTVINDNTPIFTWTEVPGAMRYAVVAKDSSGTYLVNNSTGNITCPDGICSYTKDNTIFPDGAYSWNVRVINPDNSNGASSSTVNFSVETQVEPINQIVDACQQGQTPVGNIEVTAGNAVCLQEVSDGGQRQMHFYIPDERVGSTLEIILSHGSGDGILLYKHDDRPTSTVYDDISSNPGNEERIRVQNVQRSWNYIHVQTETSFSGATLLARFIE